MTDHRLRSGVVPRFLVTRAPGLAWDLAKPTREQAGWEPHAAFMDSLADERFVAFGGPADDENKVVLVVDALDEATIRTPRARPMGRRPPADYRDRANRGRSGWAETSASTAPGGSLSTSPHTLPDLTGSIASRVAIRQGGTRTASSWTHSWMRASSSSAGRSMGSERWWSRASKTKRACGPGSLRTPGIDRILTIEQISKWNLWLPPRPRAGASHLT